MRMNEKFVPFPMIYFLLQHIAYNSHYTYQTTFSLKKRKKFLSKEKEEGKNPTFWEM